MLRQRQAVGRSSGGSCAAARQRGAPPARAPAAAHWPRRPPPPAQAAPRWRREAAAQAQQPQRRAVAARALPEQPPSGAADGLGNGGGAADGAGAAGAGAGPSSGGTPAFIDGVNWYCYSVLGLLFLVDFTPLGAALGGAGAAAPFALAAFQAAVFVAPTLAWAARRGWDLKRTFRTAPASGAWLAAGGRARAGAAGVGWAQLHRARGPPPRVQAAWARGRRAPSTSAPPPSRAAAAATAGLCLGPVLWGATTAVIALKTGSQPLALPPPGGAAGDSVMGGMVAAAAASDASAQAAAALLAAAAAAPALMEELLFRGLLLTALQQRLGRVDAVAVCGALFALSHLSVPQFFPFALLGFAAGGVAVASGSVWPAVLLHFSYNSTGLALGLALHAAV
jgi:membrane protease YdiL (CAAX protease family)